LKWQIHPTSGRLRIIRKAARRDHGKPQRMPGSAWAVRPFFRRFFRPAQSAVNAVNLFAFCLLRHGKAGRIVFFIEQIRRAGLRWPLQAFCQSRNKTVLFMTQLRFMVIQLNFIKYSKLMIGTAVAKSLSTLNLWRLR